MKLGRLIAVGVALFGAMFVAVAVFQALGDRERIAGSKTADGVVTANEYERDGDGGGYRAVVRFATEDGRTVDIRSRVRSRPAAFSVGETVRVFYEPAAPDGALIDSFRERWMLALIFGGLGGLALAIGLGLFAYFVVTGRRDHRLRTTGERVAARVLGVSRNPGVIINREEAWRVDAEWSDPATGALRREKSRNLAYDPAPWLKPEIDVYLDRADPRNYLVDLAPVEAARSGPG